MTSTNHDNDENVVRRVVKGMSDAIGDIIYRDPHEWSERPCPTCRVVTAFFGWDYGCVRFGKESAPKVECRCNCHDFVETYCRDVKCCARGEGPSWQ